MTYKIGDRVRCTKTYEGRPEAVGKIGTIVIGSNERSHTVGVEFDEFINGHSCTGKGKDGHCWNIDELHIEHAKGRRRKLKTPEAPEYHVVMQDDCRNIVSGPAPYKEIVDRLTMNGNRTYTVYKLVPVANIQNKKVITKIIYSTKKKRKKKK